MRVFVSCQAVDRKPAGDLIRELRMAGIEVEHSPRNPLDGNDPRWEGWYQAGLAAAIGGCDVFVIVVDDGWDSSTWMAIEADAALAVPQGGSPLRLFFWNPEATTVKAAGMVRYLKHELPRGLDRAISCIASSTG
jgi:TIR domain